MTERSTALRLLALALAVLTLAAPAAAQDEAGRSAANIKAHVTFLASDLLLGREPGEPGYDIAANYVASQFAQLGLTPAGGDGSYFQKVPLYAFRNADQGQFSLKARDGSVTPLVFGEDVLPGRPLGASELQVSAPMVFVGFGVVAPEAGRDDYKGLNVKGKIVVALAGAPATFQTERRAYYAGGRVKRAEAAKRGAVGFVSVYLPGDERRQPFARAARGWQAWSMSWTAPDGTPFNPIQGAPVLATLSVAGAAKLFAGAKVSYDEVAASAEGPKADPPRFVLPGTFQAAVKLESRTVMSANVAGLIPGSDPKLKNELIVLTAHLDHIGVETSGEGDRINNGALDNAGGIATTLEVARAFMAAKPPRRSVLVLAVTAEEKGLIGSEYFARNPSVPGARMVGNVNLDMPVLTYDFTDVVAFGSERSTMGAAVQRAAKRLGIALSPDPMPEEGLFTRSDHFRFVEAGVPSMFLLTGFQNGGEAKFRGFLAGCYHRPCDDLSQPIDWAAGARFARINYEIARELADDDVTPAWIPGDFFGVKFGPAAPAATQR
jgi:hypothetical protein